MAIRALSTAATGMTAMQRQVDVLSNNLANVNTTGFKRQRAEFEDLLYQHLKQPGFAAEAGNQVPTGVQVGLGVRFVATNRIFTQGSLVQTDNDLDVAIDGDGFFRVVMPDGSVAFTRDGSFKRDGAGNLVTSNGLFLDPQITVPENIVRVQISPQGIVEGFDPTQPTQVQQLGELTLTRFPNPAGLLSIGDNLYQQTPASGTAIEGRPGEAGLGVLRQHFLEESNVDVVRELVDLITAQRSFEINAQSIQTADQMLQTVNNLRR